MNLDLQCAGISKTLAIRGIREVGHTELVKDELNEGMVVVDIGANIGYYALIEASIVGKNGKVYAIEPDPRNFETLKSNIELNGFSDIIEISQMAVSDFSGMSKFYLSEATNLNTAFDPENCSVSLKHKVDKVIDIENVSLDDFMKDREQVNFIRMDIEGFEVEAFRGMLNTLATSHSCKILFEVHPSAYNETRDIRVALKDVLDLGYSIKVMVSAGQAAPKQFSDLGYKPAKTIVDGNFHRGFYYDVKPEHAIQFASDKNKCVRYIMLERA